MVRRRNHNMLRPVTVADTRRGSGTSGGLMEHAPLPHGSEALVVSLVIDLETADDAEDA
jgi:hypothetical protein